MPSARLLLLLSQVLLVDGGVAVRPSGLLGVVFVFGWLVRGRFGRGIVAMRLVALILRLARHHRLPITPGPGTETGYLTGEVPTERKAAGPEAQREGYRPAEELIPPKPSLKKLREAAADCHACPLWRAATQTVFGKGSPKAKLMLVGEQPGDREDRAGEPFVGPAGEVLAKALEEAGIDRGEAYVTNVVKHFKWAQGRGKRRLHQRPNVAEVTACRPWLDAELAVVRPEVLVCLGATAAKALLGSKVRVTTDRGRFLESDIAPAVSVTVHPSSILRIDDDAERREARAELTADLRKIGEKLNGR